MIEKIDPRGSRKLVKLQIRKGGRTSTVRATAEGRGGNKCEELRARGARERTAQSILFSGKELERGGDGQVCGYAPMLHVLGRRSRPRTRAIW